MQSKKGDNFQGKIVARPEGKREWGVAPDLMQGTFREKSHENPQKLEK